MLALPLHAVSSSFPLICRIPYRASGGPTATGLAKILARSLTHRISSDVFQIDKTELLDNPLSGKVSAKTWLLVCMHVKPSHLFTCCTQGRKSNTFFAPLCTTQAGDFVGKRCSPSCLFSQQCKLS